MFARFSKFTSNNKIFGEDSNTKRNVLEYSSVLNCIAYKNLFTLKSSTLELNLSEVLHELDERNIERLIHSLNLVLKHTETVFLLVAITLPKDKFILTHRGYIALERLARIIHGNPLKNIQFIINYNDKQPVIIFPMTINLARTMEANRFCFGGYDLSQFTQDQLRRLAESFKYMPLTKQESFNAELEYFNHAQINEFLNSFRMTCG